MIKRASPAHSVVAEPTEYSTVADAARRLQLSPSTVWRWIAAGKLTAYRVGPKAIRIKTADLEAMIQPAQATRKGVKAPMEPIKPPTPQELARRQALVQKILAAREQRVITPLTSADLIRMVREDEQHAYGRPR